MNHLHILLFCLVTLLGVPQTLAATTLTPRMQTSVLVRGGHGKVPSPRKVLLAGDSLMESLGPQMKRELAGYTGIEFFPIGKKSTGLCRPDFYNWPQVLEKNLAEVRPDVVLMWVGTNDNQGVYGLKGAPLLSRPWKYGYYAKVKEIFDLCTRYRAALIIMGPPVLRDSQTDGEIRGVSETLFYCCKYLKCGFINMRPVLADKSGAYLQTADVKEKVQEIRTRDGVHITEAGNDIVMDHILPLLSYRLWVGKEAYISNSAPGNKRPLRQRNTSGRIYAR